LAEKIVITHQDLRDPRIDEVLDRERAFREVAARARPVGGLRRFFLSSTFYLAIVGALGGFLGWLAVEPTIDDGEVFAGKVTEVDPGRSIGVCPSCRRPVPVEEARPGEDRCPNCNAAVQDYPIRGAFRLDDDLVVYVIPGATRVRTGAGEQPLKSVEEIPDGATARVVGSLDEDGSDMIARLIDVRPGADAGAPRAAGRKTRAESPLRSMLVFAIVGGLISLMIGAVEGLASLNPGQALKSGLIGLGIGFGGGLAGLIPAGLLYSVSGDLTEKLAGHRLILSLDDLHGWPLFSQIVSRSMAWGVVGMALGLGQGVAMKSKRLVFNGLIGGLLGGLFGGMLFDPIAKLTPASDTADLSRAVGFTSIGLLVGLCIGMVEQLSKEAWLLLRTGPLQGKQFVVHRSPTTIGGVGQCDIFLFRDPAVQPEHARLTRVGRAFEIEDLDTPGGTFVNGTRVQRRILRDGDTISIGGTELEYRSRGS
jgi:hypothetical protein